MRTFGRFVKLVLQTQYNASFIAGVINRQKFLDWGIFQTVCKGELASLNLSSVFFSNTGLPILPILKNLDFLNFCLCWKSLELTKSEKDRNGFCPHFDQWSNSVSIGTILLFHYCLPPELLSIK